MPRAARKVTPVSAKRLRRTAILRSALDLFLDFFLDRLLVIVLGPPLGRVSSDSNLRYLRKFIRWV